MLSIKHLFLKYTREFYALYDIKVALVGEDNSGKTSLLRIISKLEKPTKGEVYIKDRPLKKVNYRSDISAGYVPASPVFLENKTVYENFKYILNERKISPAEIESKINEAVIEFSLEKIKDEKISNLTVEEKYILSLIRLSFRKLDFLMIDNIFENLSDFYIEVIEEILEKLVQPSTTLIVATTDEKIADRFCKRKIYFKSPQSSVRGSRPAELCGFPRLRGVIVAL